MQKWFQSQIEHVTNAVADGIVEGLKRALIWLITSFANGSYWICLIIALICLILYAAGMKKAGKYVGISFIVFFVLQCIKVVLP